MSKRSHQSYLINFVASSSTIIVTFGCLTNIVEGKLISGEYIFKYSRRKTYI